MKFAVVMLLVAVSQCFLKVQVDDKCKADVQAVIAGGQKVVNDVLSLNWAAAKTDIEALIPLADQTVADCANDIPAACKNDITAAQAVLKAVVADVEAKDFTAAITDAKKLIPLALQAKKDCVPQLVQENVCQSDINALVPEVQTVVADLLAKNWTQAEQAVIALEPLALKTVKDCLLTEACKADIAETSAIIKQTVADVKAKDWYKVIEDASKVVPEVQKIQKDCFAQQAKPVKGIDQTCINDIVMVLADLETVVSDVESFNIVGAIQAAEQVVPAGKKAVADCTAPSALQAISSQCVADVTGIVQEIGNIVVDIEKQDWSNVFIQAAAIVKSGVAFKNDCL